MPYANDLTGEKFGKLTVLSLRGRNEKREAIYQCRCECGMITDVRMAHLRNGHAKSCGCIRGRKKVTEVE